MEAITDDTRKFTWERIEHTGMHDIPSRLVYPFGTLIGSRIYLKTSSSDACLWLDIVKLKWHKAAVENWHSLSLRPCLVDDKIVGITRRSDREASMLVLFDPTLEVCTEREIVLPHGVVEGGFSSVYVEFMHQLAVFGGRMKGKSLATLVLIDTETLEAKAAKPKGSPPSPRNGHACCSMNGASRATMFVYGGRKSVKYYNDLHVLHFYLSSLQWSRVRTDNATRSAYSSCTYIAGKLFLYGGFDSKHNDISLFESTRLIARLGKS